MAQVLKSNAALKQASPGATPQLPMSKPSQGTVILGTSGGVNKSQQSVPQAVPLNPTPGMPGVISTSMLITSNGATTITTSGSAPSQSVTEENSINHKDTYQCNQLNLANTKEKTPMCLINELARYNKIQHQYTLTDEQGPAHKKTFYVKLKLGEEEYAASGASIKKAQHAAAATALEKTQYKHPPPKVRRGYGGVEEILDNGPGNSCHMFSDLTESITPTVELNALVMKRGEPAVYRPIEMPRPQYFPPPNLDFRGMYNQRYHYPQYPRVFYVSLKVGQREFIGDGNTRQSARHNAAAKALKVLRNLPLPNQSMRLEPELEGDADSTDSCDSKDALKSEISLVHEIALKRNLPVSFEVIRESGPPHMRLFVTRCIVGDLVTEGDGNGKKVSKKRAAEKMLDQLKTLPGIPPSVIKPKRNGVNKKKNRNLIKLQKADPNYGVGINPISRLIQIQQAKKEKEPVYTMVTERGAPRRREFVMQVQVGEHLCPGVGPNKKLAKRSAAEAMLQLLGYSRPSPQPTKPAIKSEGGQVTGDKKVTFLDPDGNPSRQLVPGVLLMPDGTGPQHSGGMGQAYIGNQVLNLNRAPGSPLQPNHMGNSNYSPQTTATIAQELLDTGSSPTAEALVKCGTWPTQTNEATIQPKQQLLYLAEVLGFKVQFTDFPKGTNKNEFLSLVSLSTNPPQVSHGAGATIEASHDIAARTALKALAELGIDAVTDKSKTESDKMAAGDGPHVKTEADSLANSSDLGTATIKTESN